MYEYIFVDTSLGGLWSEPTHRETIQKYAKEGWRLVQVLPTNYGGDGKPAFCDIIFERQVVGGNGAILPYANGEDDSKKDE